MVTALSDIMRITALAAIAETEVNEAIRSENQRAAVIVPVRLRDLEQDSFCRQISLFGIRLGDMNLAQNAAFWGLLTVIEIEQTILLVLRVKCECEQSL